MVLGAWEGAAGEEGRGRRLRERFKGADGGLRRCGRMRSTSEGGGVGATVVGIHAEVLAWSLRKGW